jgi:outer membrane protein OmpA-like peptidoglycan-associated protein/uncharacterized membrane protein (UPF0127 family)
MPTLVSDAALLLTRSGAQRLELSRAASFLSRFLGLMGRRALAPDAGLLLDGCPSVHTAFMRFPIDVVYLDRQGVVLKCVAGLRPWRASVSNAGRDRHGQRHARAAHTLELAAGSIARWGIAPGDRLQHPLWFAPATAPQQPPARLQAVARGRQQGAAIIELAVVGPLLTLMGLGAVQYSQLFFAKNQLDHAAFLAARAGSVQHADLTKIKNAYAEGLIPMYGGGQTAAELADALGRALADVNDPAKVRVELMNPTKEAFQDFNDTRLQALLNTNGKRVISNRSLAFKSNAVGATSGETIQDANLIKLRITQGIEPAVPIVGSIYKAYLKWQDTGGDAVQTTMISNGRVPVVTHVTLQMQSDAIEPDNPYSSPGNGNGGNPSDPGDPPVTTDPPPDNGCPLGGCSTPPGGGGAGSCPVPIASTLSADTLFGFDQDMLQADGKAALDRLIASTHGQRYDTLTVTGYTDQIGTDAYNQDLSRRRAQAVRDYLIQHGLLADHVNVVGAGASNPVVQDTACAGKSGAELQACYAPNRRVVVQLTPKN